MTRTTTHGPACPANPDHGAVLPITNPRWGWYCPHRAHDGDRKTPPTRAFFTTVEVDTGLRRSVNELCHCTDRKSSSRRSPGHVRGSNVCQYEAVTR